MKSIKQFFEYMQDVSFPYVVLRNWENLPDSVELGEHSDLDLLVYDLDHWQEVISEARRVYLPPRVQFRVPIGDSFILVDVRSIGDGYYPANFQREILNGRIKHENGFHIPDKAHYLLALAYHAVHHKNSNNYPEILGNATIEELGEALKKSGIGWVEPDDFTVGKYYGYLKGSTSVVQKGKNGIIKRQFSYNKFSLLDREARILKKAKSRHFPKLLKELDNELEIEDCGECLTVNNLPQDWKKQLIEIINDLRESKIQHNDIKRDNLMVKSGVIKLIDWGWSSIKGEDINHFPKCLGRPNRPSWGPDDNFAMKKVVKEFQYQEENKNAIN